MFLRMNPLKVALRTPGATRGPDELTGVYIFISRAEEVKDNWGAQSRGRSSVSSPPFHPKRRASERKKKKRGEELHIPRPWGKRCH